MSPNLTSLGSQFLQGVDLSAMEAAQPHVLDQLMSSGSLPTLAREPVRSQPMWSKGGNSSHLTLSPAGGHSPGEFPGLWEGRSRTRKKYDMALLRPTPSLSQRAGEGERATSPTSYGKVCTRHIPVLVLQSLHTVHPSSTLYFKACRGVLPSTTSYYKVCRTYFPVLLRATKFACTKHFPALLRTTKFAQSISQHHFGLQSLHKALPGTTSEYKACRQYSPVLLRTAKLSQSISRYNAILQSLHPH